MLMVVLAFLLLLAECSSGAPGSASNYQPFLDKTGLKLPVSLRWQPSSLPASCKEILEADGTAASGEYYLSAGKKVVLVYCEMGLNGGGYTFLHPTAIASMTDKEVQAIFTDKSSFLMRTLRANNRQTVSLLTQLHNYAEHELKLGLNQHDGYQGPANALGDYLFFGFIPATAARSRTVQGLQVNSRSVQFTNCDGNGNSHFVLSPNFAEKAPTHTGRTTVTCQKFFTYGTVNPSSRLLPNDFFMFAEMHFGGCGCLTTSSTVHESVVAVTIGFR